MPKRWMGVACLAAGAATGGSLGLIGVGGGAAVAATVATAPSLTPTQSSNLTQAIQTATSSDSAVSLRTGSTAANGTFTVSGASGAFHGGYFAGHSGNFITIVIVDGANETDTSLSTVNGELLTLNGSTFALAGAAQKTQLKVMPLSVSSSSSAPPTTVAGASARVASPNVIVEQCNLYSLYNPLVNLYNFVISAAEIDCPNPSYIFIEDYLWFAPLLTNNWSVVGYGSNSIYGYSEIAGADTACVGSPGGINEFWSHTFDATVTYGGGTGTAGTYSPNPVQSLLQCVP